MADSSSTSSSGPGHNTSLNNVALDTAGSKSFVLTPAGESTSPISNVRNTQSSNNLTVPNTNTTEPVSIPASTPVIKPQAGGKGLPHLSLDNMQKEAMTTTATKQSNSGASSNREVSPASNLITQSPYKANEGLTISPGTSLWHPRTSTGSTQAGSPRLWAPTTARQNISGASPRRILPTSNLITQSPYEANENVKFSGEPTTRAPVVSNKRLEALKGLPAQQPTCLPGHVASPASNGNTSTPRSMWQSGK